jgi:hypothetical protein
MNIKTLWRVAFIVHVVVVLFVFFMNNEAKASSKAEMCSYLSMYGNGLYFGQCHQLSIPNAHNQWVCELQGAPDVHTTFNASTDFHITVKKPEADDQQACDEHSYLTGLWVSGNGSIALAGDQQGVLCGVSVQPFIDKLNAILAVPFDNSSACKAGFLNASIQDKISIGDAQKYMNLCQRYACP